MVSTELYWLAAYSGKVQEKRGPERHEVSAAPSDVGQTAAGGDIRHSKELARESPIAKCPPPALARCCPNKVLALENYGRRVGIARSFIGGRKRYALMLPRVQRIAGSLPHLPRYVDDASGCLLRRSVCLRRSSRLAGFAAGIYRAPGSRWATAEVPALERDHSTDQISGASPHPVMSLATALPATSQFSLVLYSSNEDRHNCSYVDRGE